MLVKKEHIASIIVLYKPNIKYLKKILKQHLINFSKVFLINNSPEVALDCFISNKVVIVNNAENIGLAKAINVGIIEAEKHNLRMVALFDQDTSLSNDFLSNMIKYINKYVKSNKIAVFAPVYFNRVTNHYGSIINFSPFRLLRTMPKKNTDFYYPHYVITSGSFIFLKTIKDVGFMTSKLFIDFVDIEWCLRARAKGYDIVSFPQVEIAHHLGESSVSFMGTNSPIHSPLRMYYYFRNAIYLYRLRELDWNWRVVDATRNLFRFLFYMVFVKNRPTYFKYIIKGYYHGLIKRMGKLEE